MTASSPKLAAWGGGATIRRLAAEYFAPPAHWPVSVSRRRLPKSPRLSLGRQFKGKIWPRRNGPTRTSRRTSGRPRRATTARCPTWWRTQPELAPTGTGPRDSTGPRKATGSQSRTRAPATTCPVPALSWSRAADRWRRVPSGSRSVPAPGRLLPRAYMHYVTYRLYVRVPVGARKTTRRSPAMATLLHLTVAPAGRCGRDRRRVRQGGAQSGAVESVTGTCHPRPGDQQCPPCDSAPCAADFVVCPAGLRDD